VRLASEKLPDDELALPLLEPALKLVETPEPGARRILLKESREMVWQIIKQGGAGKIRSTAIQCGVIISARTYLCTGRLREYSNMLLSKAGWLPFAMPELGSLDPAAGFVDICPRAT
jgi:hypothetical protein